MTAAGAIFRKDARELVRDGRALVALGLVVLLALAAFWLSAQRIEASEAARTAANERERQTWVGQGSLNPHSAAHFSSWAFKPQNALAVVEPGLTPYYGEAIWMEAHYQNPANHRPAEDATEARRFADLSPAWLTVTLLPLVLIGLGFASLAREREGGQWRQMTASGVTASSVLRGKARLLLGLGLGIALLFTVPAVVGSSGLPSPGDAITRWLLIFVAVLLYAAAMVGVTLAVSAGSRTTRGALLGLVAFWMLSVVLAPRLAASAAEALSPAPSTTAFASQVTTDLEQGIDGHSSSDERTKQLEAATLRRYGVTRTEDLPVSFTGLSLQASEEFSNRVFDRHFGDLRAAHERQQGILRAAGLISPAIAFRNATAAFAGTDGAHHWHFVAAAETHRRDTIEMLNDDMIENAGAEGFDYMADSSFWATIPEFSYRTPGWAISRGALIDLAILFAWVVGGFLAATAAVRRWRAA